MVPHSPRTANCPKLEKSTPVAPLPTAKSNAGVCTLDNKIYCIGGWNSQFGIKQCYTCTIQPPINGLVSRLCRYQASVRAFNGLVYAVGGCNTSNYLNSVEVYDPATNTCS